MRHRRISVLALLLLPAVAAAAACGSSTNATPDAGVADSGSAVDVSVEDTGAADAGARDSSAATDAGAEAAAEGGLLGANCPAVDAGTFVEATHGPLPTVTYFGGPILSAPQLVTFTFPTTPNATTLQSFGQTITQTPWFSDVTRDYCIDDGGTCIGPGPTGLVVDIATAADTTYIDTFGQGTATGGTDLQQFINQQIGAAVTAHTIPAPGANSLYIFYFPPTSTIWWYAANQGPVSCGFGGYHNNMVYSDGKTPIVYAIVPDCAMGYPQYELPSVTIAASHEIIEATTDSQPSGVPAFYLDQPMTDAGITVAQFRNDPWATSLTFGEIGDNCESVPLDTWTLDGGNVVQRIWSTSAASAGHNPCVPVPAGESYYNASTDKALYVASVGDTFTVDVSAFSDAVRKSWRLDAIDNTQTGLTDSSGMNPLPYLKLEWVNGITDTDGVSSLVCVNNGTTGQLKVTLLADPGADMSLAGEEWPEADGVIYSADVANAESYPTPDGGTYVDFPYQFWPFAVVTPATAATLGVTSAGIADARRLAALRAAHHPASPRVMRPRRMLRQ